MDVFSEIAPYGKAKSKSAHIRLWIWVDCVVLTIIAFETKAELVTWNAAASVVLKYIAFVRQVWYFILIFFIVMCIKEIYLTNKYTKNERDTNNGIWKSLKHVLRFVLPSIYICVTSKNNIIAFCCTKNFYCEIIFHIHCAACDQSRTLQSIAQTTKRTDIWFGCYNSRYYNHTNAKSVQMLTSIQLKTIPPMPEPSNSNQNWYFICSIWANRHTNHAIVTKLSH